MDEAQSVSYTHLDVYKRQDAQQIVNLLAPVYTEEISLEGSLTKNISLFEMFNILVVDDESTCLLDDEATSLFSDDDDKTDLFDEIQATPYKFPTLIRTLTEEVIRIDQPVFRIGKEENCVDYIVSNNICLLYTSRCV